MKGFAIEAIGKIEPFHHVGSPGFHLPAFSHFSHWSSIASTTSPGRRAGSAARANTSITLPALFNPYRDVTAIFRLEVECFCPELVLDAIV
jgi:hypothetical protein